MNRKIVLNISLLILLILPIATPLVIGVSVPGSNLAKIDPELVDDMTKDEIVEFVIRVRPLPRELAAQVKGNYRSAITTLKAWAEFTQKPLVVLISTSGGYVLNRFWLDNVILVRAPGKLIQKIAVMPEVVKIFRNFEVHVIEPVEKIPVDPKEVSANQVVSSWGIFKIRAPEVWAMGYTGTGVRIAVLDTGVDITHPALAGKMLTVIPGDPYYPGGWMAFDYAGNPYRTTPNDTHGHGTHCSGTALGGDTENILIGVAPGATLMHGLVLPGGSGTFAQVLAGMQWTVEPYYLDAAGNRIYTGLPAHVVSMSFGAYEYYGNELLPAIEAMLLANIVPVAAIGNGGEGTTGNPGNIWGAFGIGATDINDNVAWFSSGKVVTWPSPPPTWPFFDVYPQTYVKPDFSAPGVNIRSSVPGGGYADWSGTSMATPHVAGVVALIYQITNWHTTSVPDTPEKVYLILNSTAIDFGAPGQDTRYGWGRIDAYEAARKALEYAKKSGVEGYVRDEITAEPIPWATVTVVEADITMPVTKEGFFRIPLDPGTYTLVFEAWGYQTITMQVEVVLLNGTITGLVYEGLTGEPIPGASVTVLELDLTVYTDENGVYTVSVPPGTYTLVAEAPGYSRASTTVTVDEAEVVVVNFALFPVGSGIIAGYVYDAETSMPIAEALVYTYVDGEYVYDVTDNEGYYEISVPSGSYTVCAWKHGYFRTCNPDVIVPPDEVVYVDFYLEPIPPTVVVLANVDYYTKPHLKDIVAALGLPVVEYMSMVDLLEDWVEGVINPKVIIIDHTMPGIFSYPPSDVVVAFHQLADALGTTLIWLGTSYSGYTGIDVLYLYNSTIVENRYPAPRSRLIGYPSPAYVQVTMLNMEHPIFEGVTPDIPPNIFYLGSGYFVDYAIYNFTDVTGRFTVLAYVNDTRPTMRRFGVGVAEWISNTGVPWYYLGSWAESFYMQYIEPGSDGVYTENTKKVLENAILIGWYATASSLKLDKVVKVVELVEVARLATKPRGLFKPQLYTYVEVYMPRLPHGYVTGKVIGADGTVLAGAKVEIVGTPITVYTDTEGRFYTWLPAGEYTAVISAPGYRSVTVTFTIEVGLTKDLGVIVLPLILRVATLYDYADSIKSVLTQAGFYAASYTDLQELIEDLSTGFYQAVVWAGYYGTPFPPCSQFFDFLDVTDRLGIGVVFMDSWGSYGYGIKMLNRCLGDPPAVGYSWGYPVYIVVTGSHPILRGYNVGDVVLIVTYTSADFSWFTGFSGTAIADTLAGGIVRGNAIAWLVRPSGSKWALLSSFAPTSWNLPTYFTNDAWNIIVNAVKWVAARPLTVEIENPYLHVGDTMRVLISGARMYDELIILLDGVEIGRTIADEEGEAVFETTIPLLPGGEHIVEVTTLDELYYGMAKLYILPKITVTPKRITAPGIISVEATGLQVLQTVYVYLDGNWLSTYAANDSGAFSIKLNIPIVAEGLHEISVVDTRTGKVLARESIEVTSRLEHIVKVVDDVKSTLSSMNLVITRIDQNIVTLQSATGEIRMRLDDLRSLVEASRYAVITEINRNIATILLTLENRTITILGNVNALAPTIASVVDSKMAVVLTEIGTLKTDLATIRSLVETSRDAVITEIKRDIATIRLRFDDATTMLNAKLDALDTKIIAIRDGVVHLSTTIGELKTRIDTILTYLPALNSTIASISSDVAVIRTGIGELQTSTGNLLRVLRDTNATVSGLIVDSSGKILARIDTANGAILADIRATRNLIEAGLPVSTSELRDLITRLTEDTKNVGSATQLIGTYTLLTMIFSVIALATVVYIAVTLAKKKI